MAKIFLEANYVIDALHRKPEKELLSHFIGHTLYASVLSFHIYCYVFKITMPNQLVVEQKKRFQLVDLTADILENALVGPTSDFEDNIQLHSATNEDCDYFLTADKNLLLMRFFGKVKITPQLLEK